MDWSLICNKLNLVDEAGKSLELKDIDKIFNEVTAIDPKKIPITGKLPQTLCRHEFLDVLVRIARHKYMERGLAKNVGEAL